MGAWLYNLVTLFVLCEMLKLTSQLKSRVEMGLPVRLSSKPRLYILPTFVSCPLLLLFQEKPAVGDS